MPKKKSIKQARLEAEYWALRVGIIPFFRMHQVGGFSNKRLSYGKRIGYYVKMLNGWIDCPRIRMQSRKRRKELNKLFREEVERWSLLLVQLKKDPDKFRARIAEFEEKQKMGLVKSNI